MGAADLSPEVEDTVGPETTMVAGKRLCDGYIGKIDKEPCSCTCECTL